jgi:4-aminobutyrate aminotransferase-like enzyme/Ser/Thr protein kinase RdoA (MazF antagonist)
MAETPQIRELLRAEYGLRGAFTNLPGENENYLVTTTDGRRFVLKLTLPEYPPELTELEAEAVEAVHAACPGLELPRLIRTNNGATSAEFATRGSFSRQCGRLYEHVRGASLAEEPPRNLADYAQLGRSLGELSNALAPLNRPAARRTHRWDLANAGAHRSNTRLIENPGRRRLADQAFLLWAALAQPFLASLPHQLIHGDLNDENLRFAEGRLCGVLDFGDTLYNPAICEVAIALTYALLEVDNPFLPGSYLVDGFHQVNPLSQGELEVLFPLMCGRLAVSVVVAAERRLIDPGRTSWFATEDRAWDAIERFLRWEPLDAADMLASRTGVEVFPERGEAVEELLLSRTARFSKALSLAYTEPVKFFRGRGPYLWDGRGRPFLDLYNNVAHVGHSHPDVAAAVSRQMSRLNTNTRYLYDELYAYADRLCATVPEPLDTCFFVNSGSEANELALRLAAAYTGREDVAVLDGAYHGHTGRLVEISPYKFNRPGGTGVPAPWVHVLPLPDGYRSRYKGQGPETGRAYADEAGELIRSAGRPLSALIAETLPSCAGQIIPPEGYFDAVFQQIRKTGGICILDEVQVGFGRVGSHFWAFERYGVCPDIVVMGKPIGNGHPLGAVVTRSEIAEALAASGMEFFSTFGGNPVSCAAGIAVLEVIHKEGLQGNAMKVGKHLLDGLLELKERYPLIGDVRGIGLFIGIELVKDRQTLEPAPAETANVVNALRRRQVLTGIDGLFQNVIKIKPPLVISDDDINLALDMFEEVLSDLSNSSNQKSP